MLSRGHTALTSVTRLLKDRVPIKKGCLSLNQRLFSRSGAQSYNLCAIFIYRRMSHLYDTSQVRIMITSSGWDIFRVTGILCGEFTGHRWIPRTKASDADLWCFLWSVLDMRLSKQSRGWRFRRHRAHYDVTVMFVCNGTIIYWLSLRRSIILYPIWHHMGHMKCITFTIGCLL